MKVKLTAELPFEWCIVCSARELKDGDKKIGCNHEELCWQIYRAARQVKLNEG